MNPYNPAMILGWRANIDLKPVLSKESAITYIAKYASKAEKQAPAFSELLASVANSMEDDGTAQSACHKMLNKCWESGHIRHKKRLTFSSEFPLFARPLHFRLSTSALRADFVNLPQVTMKHQTKPYLL